MISKTLVKELIRILMQSSQIIAELSIKPKDRNIANRMSVLARKLQKKL